jgi:hypothetical protein
MFTAKSFYKLETDKIWILFRSLLQYLLDAKTGHTVDSFLLLFGAALGDAVAKPYFQLNVRAKT